MAPNRSLQIDKSGSSITIKLPNAIRVKGLVAIEQQIVSALTSDIKQVLLDFSDIQNVYSILLTLLVRFQRKVKMMGGTMELINMPSECARQFVELNLDKVFTITLCDEEDEDD